MPPTRADAGAVMLDRPLVFLDLETTGATADCDRITEIGLIEVEDGAYVREWSTLVNPEMPIPPFIEALTGISDDMVAGAPRFAEVAQGLKERLHGKVLIAHNARFDYGFLKAEFGRLATRYAADLICTVKLSRKLYPGHARHNLDTLMQRHGIACESRHRALGDARVLWDLVQKWRAELGADVLSAAAGAQFKLPVLPPAISAHVLDELPEMPGVYLFYGDAARPVYIGKSANLRSRVLAHFSGENRTAADMNLFQQVKRIDWKETTGELGALLEESRLVRELLPAASRQARRNGEVCVFTWQPGLRQAPLLVSAADIDFRNAAGAYGAFRSRRAALDALEKLAQKFDLCRIECGLETGDGANSAQHDLRLMEALCELKLQTWPFKGAIGVREARAQSGEMHVLDHWCYLGTVRSDNNLDTLDARPAFDLDIYKTLQRILKKPRAGVEIVPITAVSLEETT
ncbi:MAG: exonuclease domain-containing protein [Burkholderiales bacterium]